MDIYRLILKSAANGFYNHRGEEITLKDLNKEYNSKNESNSASNHK